MHKQVGCKKKKKGRRKKINAILTKLRNLAK